jgi:uncharacterized protein YxeA
MGFFTDFSSEQKTVIIIMLIILAMIGIALAFAFYTDELHRVHPLATLQPLTNQPFTKLVF